MSLQVFGRAGFAEALSRGFELAELVEEAVTEMPDWEVVTPAQMGVVTFRYAPQAVESEALDWLNRELVGAMVADGYAMISSTALRGKTVLRMCTINPRTTVAEVQGTLARLDGMGRRLLAEQR
jgi:glutamate/tyrosine decarboxylase-like PLP-dependent enzyme